MTNIACQATLAFVYVTKLLVYNVCCAQGHLEKSQPAVKEVTERPSHGQQLNPTSKLLWELQVPAEGSAELNIEYGVKMWK